MKEENKLFITFNRNTQIVAKSKAAKVLSVALAAKSLRRDFDKACIESSIKGSEIWLVDGQQESECYRLEVKNGRLEIQGSDALGFIYGIYAVSKRLLGINEFWFWMDQKIVPKAAYTLNTGVIIQSNPYAIRWRGWFFNDEVLLQKWSVDGKKDEPWVMGFEALLRCGGNMVIPGTGSDAEIYHDIASSMGLYITHHHAEPLGSQMFLSAFPDLEPSYSKYKTLFEKLWKEAVEKNKDCHTIWTLAFRGQGDTPFWEDDPEYKTSESRGRLMSEIIKKQYDIVHKANPKAVCCTNLYGETLELYKGGYLQFPDDVIRIWADNGFGKMVSRRQGNHNPRVPSLPTEKDSGHHGIYYHASFYDLQAASHITMLPNSPDFVHSELRRAICAGATEYWIINCSNIKPHVYLLDLIAQIWRYGDADIEAHRKLYATAYYGSEDASCVSDVLADYSRCAVKYGPNEDDHAGEQFVNHVPRMLISQYMRGNSKADKELLWATDEPTLQGQVLWYKGLCEIGRKNYSDYIDKCRKAQGFIKQEESRELFCDTIMLQAQIYSGCYSGASEVCKSLLCALDKDYKHAFFYAGLAKQFYEETNMALRRREHDKWQGYYANECLTDIKQTAWVLRGLMSYIRNLSDGPHFYTWQREYLYSERERRVMLVLNWENHLTDDEIWKLMKDKFIEHSV